VKKAAKIRKDKEIEEKYKKWDELEIHLENSKKRKEIIRIKKEIKDLVDGVIASKKNITEIPKKGLRERILKKNMRIKDRIKKDKSRLYKKIEKEELAEDLERETIEEWKKRNKGNIYLESLFEDVIVSNKFWKHVKRRRFFYNIYRVLSGQGFKKFDDE